MGSCFPEVRTASAHFGFEPLEISVALDHDVDDLLVSLVAELKEVYAPDTSSIEKPSPRIEDDFHAAIRRYSQRKKKALPEDINTAKPGIVIGNDYFWELVLSRNIYKKTPPNGYTLIHTKLGNIITGNVLQNTSSFLTLEEIDALENPLQHKKLEELVEKFWSLESAGIKDDAVKSDDDECLQEFNDTIYFDQDKGRYMVRLPFKEELSNLSDNSNLALSRLSSNVNVLRRKPGMLQKYHNTIMEQLQRGIIEEVRSDDNPPHPTTCHYLPHHGVISETSKNTKLRCVHDGSAKTKGKRTYNILYRRSVLLPEIAAGTINYHLSSYTSLLAQKILRNIYVNNLLLEAENSADSENTQSVVADGVMPGGGLCYRQAGDR
ncbi:hypothetical protein Y032_0521g2869 [Ancylostoma ceylanicum]|uniref:Uncharacterized protein n=1 Tax=Ancylostoma ceylanicum TaxID=53326 RepID=A0A016WSW7_9BILA|nr:hypothetical protein Y032_0521g2869 [Ancylostoma ceylanicum]